MKKTLKPAVWAPIVARGESRIKTKTTPATKATQSVPTKKPVSVMASPKAGRAAKILPGVVVKSARSISSKPDKKELAKPKSDPVQTQTPVRTQTLLSKKAIVKTPPKVAPPKASRLKAAAQTKTLPPKTVELAPVKPNAAGKSVSMKPAPLAAKTEGKAKRARVPADLAAQYGERVNEKAASRVDVVETKARRPRRTAAARAKLQELLRPDESVVERLARLHSAGATLPRTSSRRSKHWETRCGKCGTSGKYAVAATLCARCGTILIRAD